MDDKIRLALEILGASDAKELATQIRAMKSAFTEATPVATKLEADTYELADAYEVLAEEQRSVLTSAAKVGEAMKAASAAQAQAQAKLAEAMDPVTHALAEVTAAADREATATAKATANHVRLARAGATTAKGMGSLQQTITAAGYAFQDFTATSGDLGAKLNSVSNNLPTLLAGLGGLGQVLAVGATAGIAIYRSWDQIAGFWEARNPFPKAARDVEGLKRELERAKDETEKLEEAGTGNATQLEKYNQLRAKTAELEKKVADEQERQARLKKFLEAPSEGEQDRARAYTEATAGRGGETLGKIEEAMRRDAEGRITAASAARNNNVAAFNQSDATDDEKKRFAEEETRKFRDLERDLRSNDWGERAKELNDRLLLGEERAGKILELLMAETGVTFDGLAKRMKERSKEGKEEKEFDEAAAKIFQDLTEKERKDALEFDRHAAEVYASLVAKEKKDAEEFDAQAAKDFAKTNKAQADVDKGAVKRANEREDASIEGSGIGLEAGRMLAQVQAAGGAPDKSGRFRKLTPEQQFEYVRRQVAQYLHRQTGVDKFGRPVRANAGLGAEETHDLSTRITATGQQQVDRRMTGMAGKQLDNTGKLFQVAAGLNTEVAQLQAKIAQQGQMIDNLAGAVTSRQRKGGRR